MNQKHLLRFIKSKLRKEPDTVCIVREGKRLTLSQVFESLQLTAYDLSIDTLDMHADFATTFARFDRFNLKYNPLGQARLREIFLKTNNIMGGRFLAEITKEVFTDLEANKYQVSFTIYWCNVDVQYLFLLFSSLLCCLLNVISSSFPNTAFPFMAKREASGLPSPTGLSAITWRRHVYVGWFNALVFMRCTRRTTLWRTSESFWRTFSSPFSRYVYGSFLIVFDSFLWLYAMHLSGYHWPFNRPPTPPVLDHRIWNRLGWWRVQAWNLVWKRRTSTVARRLELQGVATLPILDVLLCYKHSCFEQVSIHFFHTQSSFSRFLPTIFFSPCRLRAERGLTQLSFRPHAGEAGNFEHLAATFLTAEHINHGINLKRSPPLQYLYYLTQIGLAMSPLSNNRLFLEYTKNPIADFFAKGLNVSLSTDDPLMLHYTREPLVEEFAVAVQVFKFTSADMAELARNSVLQSG